MLRIPAPFIGALGITGELIADSTDLQMRLDGIHRPSNTGGEHMRLGGWKRLGIVLSVVWAIGAFIYTRENQIDAADELFQMKSKLCFEEHGAPISRCFERYSLQDAMKDTASWADVAFFAIAPPLVGWLVLFLTVQAVGWIRNGFRGA